MFQRFLLQLLVGEIHCLSQYEEGQEKSELGNWRRVFASRMPNILLLLYFPYLFKIPYTEFTLLQILRVTILIYPSSVVPLLVSFDFIHLFLLYSAVVSINVILTGVGALGVPYNTLGDLSHGSNSFQSKN